MDEEKPGFFEQLRQLYQNREKIESKIVGFHMQKQFKISHLYGNEEQINCMDLIDISENESFIIVCSDAKIKLYSHTTKLDKLFEFVIQFEANEHLDYDGLKNEKQKKFLRHSKQLTTGPVKELIMFCHFGYIHDQLYVFAGGDLGYVYQIEIKENPEYFLLEGHHNVITGLASNNKGVFSSSKDGSIIQWDVTNRQIVQVLRDGDTPEAEVLCVSANQEHIIGAYSDGKLKLWTIQDYKNDSWTYKINKQPTIIFQGPLQDIYPHITQIFLLKQTIVTKHLNGILNYFVFDLQGRTISLRDWEMSNENYWESIDVKFPYLIYTCFNRMQVITLKKNKLTYEAELDVLPSSKLTISKISNRLIVIGRMNQYTILQQ
ncbi:unnamed protein product [Paramecium primaurelia]|uniref:Uncharacterized protein n=1 Tax=Paramecium primaurelia TaxID=5886 RepID=A0A8S1L729_PARPR|nr:unnamed protein product [Paramecium primaurelia]